MRGLPILLKGLPILFKGLPILFKGEATPHSFSEGPFDLIIDLLTKPSSQNIPPFLEAMLSLR